MWPECTFLARDFSLACEQKGRNTPALQTEFKRGAVADHRPLARPFRKRTQRVVAPPQLVQTHRRRSPLVFCVVLTRDAVHPRLLTAVFESARETLPIASAPSSLANRRIR